MKRGWLALALLCGCTTDFFVGPDAAGTSSGGAQEPPSETDDPDPSTSGPPDADTTGTSIPDDPTPSPETATGTSGTDTTGSTTGDGDPTNPGESDPGTAGEGETRGETSDDPCAVEDETACLEAGPACTWDGRICTSNPCDAEGPESCQGRGEACLWTGEACIENPCETDPCIDLPMKDCLEAPGCVALEGFCALDLCVPCGEVIDVEQCDALPLCAYSELDEACVG